MRQARSLATLCIVLSALAGGAVALGQERPAAQQDAPPDARPQAQEERAAQPSPRTASQPRQRPRRRSVQQIIATVPPAAPSYGPALYPRPNLPAPASAPGLPPSYPPPPTQINTCSGGMCTDAAGNTYGTGVGNAAVNRQGHLCNRVGTTMQCF